MDDALLILDSITRMEERRARNDLEIQSSLAQAREANRRTKWGIFIALATVLGSLLTALAAAYGAFRAQKAGS